MNGSGSVGSVVQGRLAPLLRESYGWEPPTIARRRRRHLSSLSSSPHDLSFSYIHHIRTLYRCDLHWPDGFPVCMSSVADTLFVLSKTVELCVFVLAEERLSFFFLFFFFFFVWLSSIYFLVVLSGVYIHPREGGVCALQRWVTGFWSFFKSTISETLHPHCYLFYIYMPPAFYGTCLSIHILFFSFTNNVSTETERTSLVYTLFLRLHLDVNVYTDVCICMNTYIYVCMSMYI